MSQKSEGDFENYKRAVACKDLQELMNLFKYGDELQRHYESEITFAPDSLRYLENRISMLSNNIRTRQVKIETADGQQYDIGKYTVIGFAWGENGHRGSSEEFITSTQCNLTINALVAPEQRYRTYYMILYEIARGAATAFHIALLRKKLKTLEMQDNSPIPGKPSLPTSDLDQNGLLWLKTVYAAGLENKRLSVEEIKYELKDKIPVDYFPDNIDQSLLTSNGEVITILGIRKVEGNDLVINKCDAILTAAKNFLLAAKGKNRVNHDEIASKTGISENEVSLLLLLMSYHVIYFNGSGSAKSGYHGVEFISFDTASYQKMLQLPDMTTILINFLQRLRDSNQEDVDAENKKNKSPNVSAQVHLIRFLLDHCGVDINNNKTRVAELVLFLTGRESGAKRPQDTTVYKKISNPLALDDRQNIKDLQLIRPYLENIGLEDVVEKIDKEIKQSQSAIGLKKIKKNKKGG